MATLTPSPALDPPAQVQTISGSLAASGAASSAAGGSVSLTYPIVDTGQTTAWGLVDPLIRTPTPGSSFYGQDSSYSGAQPRYQDNGDGTVTDLVTGLMWQQTPTQDVTWSTAVDGADDVTTGGYDDWRLPTIKELYSLILFSGETGYSAASSTPYIETSLFDFSYGNEAAGERFMDAQYWSATEYLGTTINGAPTAFGVNFADGRIKGYPTSFKTADALYVRGNPDYGTNAFIDNGDGTITDAATGLMWTATDSGYGMPWDEALTYAETLTTAGYTDWRLPNAKELQSIVEYNRAPDPITPTDTNTGPAIDPVFSLTNIGTASAPEYPYVWTGTTHVEGGHGTQAVYLSFGSAWGYFQDPRTGQITYQDVHGAGAQRSDPKVGDASDYPTGRGPQGDEIRIDNHVIAVRTLTDAEMAALQADSTDPESGGDWRLAWEEPLREAVALHGQDAVEAWVRGTHPQWAGWLDGG